MLSLYKHFRKALVRMQPPRGRFYSTQTSTIVNEVLAYFSYPGITIVRNKHQALKAINQFYLHPNKITSWDNETINIDAKAEGPIGKGTVICASAFLGLEIDFGSGPRLFIDNYADAANAIDVFKDYFENNDFLKCWHNYGFDRHILMNHNINARGFGGDTMHMARLIDPSKTPKDKSLSLSFIYKTEIEKTINIIISNLLKKFQNDLHIVQNINLFKDNQIMASKINLKKLFSFKKTLKNGEIGKTLLFPHIEELHTTSAYISKWVEYSV